MSEMFSSTYLDINLDLSNWDVSNVRYYEGFNADILGTGTLTPPVWQNVYFGMYSEDDFSLRIYSNIGSAVTPEEGSKYEGRTVTKVYNISTESKPVSCSSTVVPTQIIVEDNISPLSTDSWFSGCTKVNKIDVSKLDTSNVTDMGSMFYNVGSDRSVTSMTIIGIDSFNTSKVKMMNDMFYNFGKNATYTLDLSGWDVSKVIYKTDFNYGVETKVIAPSKFTS